MTFSFLSALALGPLLLSPAGPQLLWDFTQPYDDPTTLIKRQGSEFFRAGDVIFRTDGRRAGTKVVARPAEGFSPAFLPDRSAIFSIGTANEANIFYLPADGGPAESVTVATSGAARQAAQAGDTILFTSSNTFGPPYDLWCWRRNESSAWPCPVSSAVELVNVTDDIAVISGGGLRATADGENFVTLHDAPAGQYEVEALSGLVATVRRSTVPPYTLWITDGTVAGSWSVELPHRPWEVEASATDVFVLGGGSLTRVDVRTGEMDEFAAPIAFIWPGTSYVEPADTGAMLSTDDGRFFIGNDGPIALPLPAPMHNDCGGILRQERLRPPAFLYRAFDEADRCSVWFVGPNGGGMLAPFDFDGVWVGAELLGISEDEVFWTPATEWAPRTVHHTGDSPGFRAVGGDDFALFEAFEDGLLSLYAVSPQATRAEKLVNHPPLESAPPLITRVQDQLLFSRRVSFSFSVVALDLTTGSERTLVSESFGNPFHRTLDAGSHFANRALFHHWETANLWLSDGTESGTSRLPALWSEHGRFTSSLDGREKLFAGGVIIDEETLESFELIPELAGYNPTARHGTVSFMTRDPEAGAAVLRSSLGTAETTEVHWRLPDEYADNFHPLGVGAAAMTWSGQTFGPPPEPPSQGVPNAIALMNFPHANERVAIEPTDQEGRVLIVARDLWTTDGTVAGTVHVTAGYPLSQAAEVLGKTGPTNVLAWNKSRSERELLFTDGTSAGTSTFDLVPGPLGSAPREGVELPDGRVAFTAVHQQLGRELWITDGSLKGTFVIADLNPGTFGSDVQRLTLGNGELIVRGVDSTRSGVWSMSLDWISGLTTPPKAEIELTKSATLHAENVVEYEIEIHNTGDFSFGGREGPEVIETFPDGLTLLAANAESGELDEVPDGLHWNLALHPGESSRLVIQASASGAGHFSNQAMALIDHNGDQVPESVVYSDDPSTPGLGDPTVLFIAQEIPALSVAGVVTLTLLLATSALVLRSRRGREESQRRQG